MVNYLSKRLSRLARVGVRAEESQVAVRQLLEWAELLDCANVRIVVKTILRFRQAGWQTDDIADEFNNLAILKLPDYLTGVQSHRASLELVATSFSQPLF